MYHIGFIISVSWIVFVVVWLASSFTAKRNLKTSWWRNASLRILIGLMIFVLFRQQLTRLFIHGHGWILTANPILAVVGALLTILGIAFAIWARFYLGTNWGMPMTLKEDRQLVTSGPYHYVRHPIYSGIMLAVFGSALAIGFWLFFVIAIYFIYFIFSAVSEEKTLTQEFPVEYPVYKKQTKMLIPFIF